MTALVVVYGPPAAGKLTVAEHLASITGFRLFHNHLTVNAVSSVFDFGDEAFARTLVRVRTAVFEEAAAAGVDLVYTAANHRRHGRDRPTMLDGLMGTARRAFESAGGRTLFAQLRPPVEVLHERVVEPSRVAHGKMTDPERYRRFVTEHHLYDRFHDDDLAIDNSSLAPEAVAGTIARELGRA